MNAMGAGSHQILRLQATISPERQEGEEEEEMDVHGEAVQKHRETDPVLASQTFAAIVDQVGLHPCNRREPHRRQPALVQPHTGSDGGNDDNCDEGTGRKERGKRSREEEEEEEEEEAQANRVDCGCLPPPSHTNQSLTVAHALQAKRQASHYH